MILGRASVKNTGMVGLQVFVEIELAMSKKFTQMFYFSAVVSAENDQKVRMSAIAPSDPLVPNQWHLPLISAFESRDGQDAWDLTLGSKEVVVAVIDTGVDYDHPDLLDNMWKNPGRYFRIEHCSHH